MPLTNRGNSNPIPNRCLHESRRLQPTQHDELCNAFRCRGSSRIIVSVFFHFMCILCFVVKTILHFWFLILSQNVFNYLFSYHFSFFRSFRVTNLYNQHAFPEYLDFRFVHFIFYVFSIMVRVNLTRQREC